jgi:hypothetical protein
MRWPFSKPKNFSPNFPIVPLSTSEEEAHRILSRHAAVEKEEEPEGDNAIAQYVLSATTKETRISAGIWNGRVRYTNYRTSLFNDTDEQKGRKLRWFVDYYGGVDEFTEPKNTGHMIFWRNPSRKLVVIFGLYLGPVRIIDQDPAHWPDSP